MATYTDELITRLSVAGADAMARDMRRVGVSMGGAATKADTLGRQMAAMNLVAGISSLEGIGRGMLNFANSAIQAAKESELMEHELAAIYRQQGVSDATIESMLKLSRSLMEQTGYSDEALNAAQRLLASFAMTPAQIERTLPLMVRQAETMGLPLENVAVAFGKAFSTGNIGALRRTGVTLGQLEMEAVDAAKKMTDFSDPVQAAAFQAKFLDIVLGAINRTTVPLGSSLNTAAGRARLMAMHIDELKENLGAGALAARAQFTTALNEMIVRLTGMNPELQKGAGALLWYGGEALTGAAKVATFTGAIGQTVIGLQAMGLALPSLAAIGTTIGAAALPITAVAAALALVVGWYQQYKALREEEKAAEEGWAAARSMEEEARRRGIAVTEGERKGHALGWWATLGDIITGRGFEGMEITGTTTSRGRRATATRERTGDIVVRVQNTGDVGANQWQEATYLR